MCLLPSISSPTVVGFGLQKEGSGEALHHHSSFPGSRVLSVQWHLPPLLLFRYRNTCKVLSLFSYIGYIIMKGASFHSVKLNCPEWESHLYSTISQLPILVWQCQAWNQQQHLLAIYSVLFSASYLTLLDRTSLRSLLPAHL